jgi:hypothetical protein
MKILVPASRWMHRCTHLVEYRHDPIPGTRCHRGARYGKTILRRPRTTQERRAYFHDEISEYDIRIRGRRTPRQLPNAWDDMCRSDIFNHKSWKNHRNTQWVDKG